MTSDVGEPVRAGPRTGRQLLRQVGLYPGMLAPRTDRMVKNGRWYWSSGPGRLFNKFGWGDLRWEHLERLATALGPGQAVFVLPETPLGGQHLPDAHDRGRGTWCWYDRPDCGPRPSTRRLIDSAQYLVVPKGVLYVDHHGRANRLGYVWLTRGYRYTKTGRFIRIGRFRVRAIAPDEAANRLVPDGGGKVSR